MIDRIFNLLFNKKKHWYSVEMQYSKNSHLKFSVNINVGVVLRSDMVHNTRPIKKMLQFWLHKEDVRHLLCNGTVKIKPVCYLGRFKDEPLKFAECLNDYLPIFWTHAIPCEQEDQTW